MKTTLIAALALATLLSGCLAHHSGAMPGEPKDATYVELEGTRVRYLDEGSGPPVILIHGFASAIEAWTTVIPALSKDHRVIALDLKGFGWTDRPEGDYSPAAQAKLVFALMDHLGVEKAAFVAHSWGCSIALRAALQSPERVSRLVLYDAWVYFDQLPTFFLLARADGIGEALMWLFYEERPAEKMSMAFYDPSIVPAALFDEVERVMGRPGTMAGALAAIRGQRFEDLEEHYGDVKQPVLLLWGREDRVTRLRFGERLLKQLPDARLEVYPLTGHFPMLEAAGASTHALQAFLAGELTPEAAEPAAVSDLVGSEVPPTSDAAAPLTHEPVEVTHEPVEVIGPDFKEEEEVQ